MKTNSLNHLLIVIALLPVACATTSRKVPASSEAGAPIAVAQGEEEDEYAQAEVSDPLEMVNRGMFKVNDGLYTAIFRPVSKGYEFVFPKPVRKGIDNAFDNVKFPVRLVNCALQGKFKRAGQETGKFFVNSLLGVGGVYKYSERIPELVDVPAEDTGQTFAKWGIGHGPYIVLPLLGPSSLRDTVGLAGDYALNPVNWGVFYTGRDHDWTYIPPTANTVRSLPAQLEAYDAAKENAVDSYISVRSAYIQNRAEAAKN